MNDRRSEPAAWMKTSRFAVWALTSCMLTVGIAVLLRGSRGLTADAPQVLCQDLAAELAPTESRPIHATSLSTPRSRPPLDQEYQKTVQGIANDFAQVGEGIMRESLSLGSAGASLDRETLLRQIELASFAAMHKAASSLVMEGSFVTSGSGAYRDSREWCQSGSTALLKGPYAIGGTRKFVVVCVPHDHPLWRTERAMASQFKRGVMEAVAREFNDLPLETRMQRFEQDAAAQKELTRLRRLENQASVAKQIAQCERQLLDQRLMRVHINYLLVASQ